MVCKIVLKTREELKTMLATSAVVPIPIEHTVAHGVAQTLVNEGYAAIDFRDPCTLYLKRAA